MKPASLRSNQAASALVLTMLMTGVALLSLATVMSWSFNSTALTHRSIQYQRTIAAAEAVTEKVVSHISRDFMTGGERGVMDNLDRYRRTVLTGADSSYWNDWEFNNGRGKAGETHVEPGAAGNYVVLNSAYAGLRGFVTSYTVVSQARQPRTVQNVMAGVLQEVQLARIPVFQFAMYSSGDMEIGCGQPFRITGLVHANNALYVQPISDMTFQSDVTAVGEILYARHPLDVRTPPYGATVYQAGKVAGVGAMTLPIGTNNSPEVIREIIQPPPLGESPSSPMGQQRYYNLVDMILTVSDAGVSATSGAFNGFATVITGAQLQRVVTTTNSFWDAREEKTIRPIDINVDALRVWSLTNKTLKPVLPSKDLTSVYVLDKRTLPGTQLGAVRLHDGRHLPSSGLTVATPHPVYVWGHYNQVATGHLGTTNTQATVPASLAGDAVTILSPNWQDSRSAMSVSSRTATPTTVNAAILAGVVETTLGQYSGGMENFPRFLEVWGGGTPFTYNGSMVNMFPSRYATNAWGKSNVYAPPARNWAFDLNFNDPNKLPPLTPSVRKVIRGQWSTVAPNSTVARSTY